jgi:hypothetical protein
MTTRSKWILLVLAGVPLLYFLFPFFCGFFALSQGYLILLAPIIFFCPLGAGIIVAKLMYNVSTATRISVGIVTCLALFALFFLVPPGAATWTLGFAANFRLTKHPVQVQQWATEVLDRYENEKLATKTNAEYWAVGQEKIEAAEIPEFIRKLWWSKPSIGIVTMTEDGITRPTHPVLTQTNAVNWPVFGRPQAKLTRCVAFSWYLTGILVGRPDFHTTWNPWYIHEIIPGVYAFSGEK